MPAIVSFDTVPQLFNGLVSRYDGRSRSVLSYKDRRTKSWVDITWEELADIVHAMAGYLHMRGVRQGDRVAILSENRPEWTITDLATQILGGVNVSLYTSLPASQVEYILKDSGAKLFITSTSIQLRKAEQTFDACEELDEVVAMSELRGEHPEYVRFWDDVVKEGASYWKENEKELRALSDGVTPADLSALIYTSGTTGTPKGVMLTHDNFCSNVKSSLETIDFFETDHHLSFLPLCHSFERTAGYLCVLAAGAKISYAESIDTVSKNLPEVRPTVMISVPRLFEKVYNIVAKSVEEGPQVKKMLFNWAVETGKKAAKSHQNGGPGALLRAQQNVAHRLVFSKLHEKLGGNLRFAVSGGAALPKKIGEFFQAAGVTIVEGYGLTETSPVLAANPQEAPRYGTVGHPLPGVTIGIQRLTDNKIAAQISGDDYPSRLSSEEGEIIARGRNIMSGYWNNEEATREAIDPDGWFHTGDVGHFDDGYLTITDRIKHMIVSAGGKNIYPGPIEDEFKTVQWVDQIMVVGEGREFLTAIVVPDFDSIEKYAVSNDIRYEGLEDLLGHESIHALFDAEFRSYSRGAASHEKIRDFRLVPEPFTVENGTMTPTMKLKRRAVEQQLGALIDEMYSAVV